LSRKDAEQFDSLCGAEKISKTAFLRQAIQNQTTEPNTK